MKYLYWMLLIGLLPGCVPRTEKEVVVYAAADREYATPVLDAFERAHPDIRVARVYDVESTKTVGLVTRIREEATQPRCDLFWNNEILHTIRLQREGLLAPHAWKVPKNWPAGYKASDDAWIGFAARARVLLVNTDKLPDATARPKSVKELADERWKGKCGVAVPLFGTTATHFAVIATHSAGGNASAPAATDANNADEWFRAVRQNAVVLAGNKQVAQAVASGQLEWGLTDTDDAIIEQENGGKVAVVYPDQQADGVGTLMIPNCVAILKNAPHRAAADALADYLVSQQTESRLTMGSSAQFPLWPDSTERSRVAPGADVRWMSVDFEKAADAWPTLSQQLRDIFSNR